MGWHLPVAGFSDSEAALSNAAWPLRAELEVAEFGRCFVQQPSRIVTTPILYPGIEYGRRGRCPSRAQRRSSVVNSSSKSCPAILAIDVGTSGTKAGLVSAESRAVLSFTRVPHRSYSAAPFHVTQDSRDWRHAAISAAREVLRATTEACETPIIAVAVTGCMQNLSCVQRKAGSLTCPDPCPPLMKDGNVLLYSDSRAIEAAQRIARRISRDVSPTSLLAKLAYLQDHTKATTGVELTSSEDWDLSVGAADSVVFDFGGELVTDPTNVSTTGLTRAPHRQYDDELLEAAGLGVFKDSLPPITSNGVCGYLSKDVACELGVPSIAGVPLVHAGGDAATTTIGANCYFPGCSQYLYMGTSGWVGKTISLSDLTKGAAEIKARNGVFYLGHSWDAGWNIELGSMMSAGSCLAWAANLLGDISIEELLQLAATAPIGSNGVTFMPYLYGRRCPEPNSRVTGRLNGLSGSTGRADVARACLEGIAFGYKSCFNSIADDSDTQTTGGRLQLPVKFVGGAARSEFVARVLSSALGTSLSIGPCDDVGIIGASQFALWKLNHSDPASAGNTYQGGNSTDRIVNPCNESLAEYEAAWLRWSEHFQDPRFSDK